MKSKKQPKEEIKAKRLARVNKLVNGGNRGVRVDATKLATNNSWSVPEFYRDRAFVCCDCGSDEVWTATQQKWWYEIAKGPIDSQAVRCRRCRKTERARVDEARRVSLEGMQHKLAAKKLREEK